MEAEFLYRGMSAEMLAAVNGEGTSKLNGLLPRLRATPLGAYAQPPAVPPGALVLHGWPHRAVLGSVQIACRRRSTRAMLQTHRMLTMLARYVIRTLIHDR